MSADTQRAPPPTVVTRVHAIPLVKDGLQNLNDLLLANTLTAWPYATAQSLSVSAYSAAQPIQTRLTPVLAPLDGLANRSIDYVEQRYPYPFQTPTNEVVADVKKQRDQFVQAALQTYDARIKAPALGIAQGADQSIAPVVNVIQAAYDRLNAMTPTDPSSPRPAHATGPDGEMQVQRAVRLAFGLKDQVLVLSSEQLRHLQEYSVIIQRLVEALHNLNSLVASSVTAAKDMGSSVTKDGIAFANSLADSTRTELDRLSATLRATPAQVQASLQPVQTQIGEAGDALAAVFRADAPAGEKAGRALHTLREQIPPLVDETLKVVPTSLSGALNYWQGANARHPAADGNLKDQPESKKSRGGVNGNGAAHY